MFGIKCVHLKRRESNDIRDETQSNIMIQQMPIHAFTGKTLNRVLYISMYLRSVIVSSSSPMLLSPP
jgi:transcriptional regulator of met regulon